MTDPPYRSRKWHLPNDAQLQHTDPNHALKTYLQPSCDDQLFLRSASKKVCIWRRGTVQMRILWCATCGSRRVDLLLRACMQSRLRISRSDLGVPQHAGAINVVDQSRLSDPCQPWRSRSPFTISSLYAFASWALCCVLFTDNSTHCHANTMRDCS